MRKHFCYVLSLAMAKKDDQQTNVRIPAQLKRRITEAAESAGRSFTAEVVLRLEASFESVLEASLLYARISERQFLLHEIRQWQERIDKLNKEMDEYKTVDPNYAAQGGIAEMVDRGIKSISEELRMTTAHLEQNKVYLARVEDDIEVIADGLQKKLAELREVKSASWLLS
ncbi:MULTISPECIES: Arc family DNA-binding protein [Stenotrophomonas]|uniref:Arc-like DNA binding domain-containing protein n=1 Tax=Stenotrophomonas maltophilia TaxID=40324 RepID=A0A2J0UCL3_STEMA|nr:MULTISPECIES: Arc family DNA-binding protein [Stenotrophomonas]MBA2130738.1 Arc family DNA-binding protein [Stenotrophomonas maltophilia]PJL31176.1 hypothetical protein B9Y64_06185 [Stenotrophomonas maltophilia]